MNVDREGRAPGEPRDGDFVAYLAGIERGQLARMNPPRAPVQTSPQPPAPLPDKQLAARRPSAGATRVLPTGSQVMMIIGALALASALFGNGGIVAFAVGIALLWWPLRRWIAGARAQAPSAPQPQDAAAAASGQTKARQ